uniref:Solute carrier family 38 member 5 n=1 Tax=Chinchilla lanigera TaxID=34839 RepID=A0A8C2UUI2_CHILA
MPHFFAHKMEMQDPKVNGALPLGAEDYRQELEGFLSSHGPAPGEKPFEGKTSFGMPVFNLSNAIMGSGILGALFFLALLLCIALLSSYSIHLLLTCASVAGIRAYEQLGQRAFGPVGEVVVATIICLHMLGVRILGTMSSYLFIIESELPLVIGAFLISLGKGDHLIITVSVLIILSLFLMKHLGHLGYTSSLSLICMLFFLISVMYQKFQICCGLHCNETAMETVSLDLTNTCEAQMFTVDSQMAYTVPIMAFAFVCHPDVLPIYTEVHRPSQRRMQAVANVSTGAIFCMYTLTATFGYLTSYSSVKEEMLYMYREKDLLILCVRLAVLLVVTLAVPVVLFPILWALQQLLFPRKAFSWPRHVVIALLLLVLVNVLVICVQNIRDIFGVIGSISLRIVPSEAAASPLPLPPSFRSLCFGILGVLFMAISLGFLFANWATGQSPMPGH